MALSMASVLDKTAVKTQIQAKYSGMPYLSPYY